MSKAKKVHQIFAILNANAPDGYRNHMQLLEDAVNLVDLFEEPANEPNFEIRTGGRTFDLWAADVAINNQPWRLVSEEQCVMEAFEMEDDRNAAAYRQARYLMEYTG
jgi:hypothetical protein